MANARNRNREVTRPRAKAEGVGTEGPELDDQVARLREVLGVLSQTYGHRALGAGQLRPVAPKPNVKAVRGA